MINKKYNIDKAREFYLKYSLKLFGRPRERYSPEELILILSKREFFFPLYYSWLLKPVGTKNFIGFCSKNNIKGYEDLFPKPKINMKKFAQGNQK
jgi:hypothetical protein